MLPPRKCGSYSIKEHRFQFAHFSRVTRLRLLRGRCLHNGELLKAAEAAGFDVLLTTDKNIRYQQNLAGRKIAIVVSGRQQWPELQAHVHLVVAAVEAATPGSYSEIEIPG